MPTTDNDPSKQGAAFPLSDSHGHAALLLVESLIHGLCENLTLRTDEAIDITDRAISVQFDQAKAADGAGAPLWRSHALLSAIAASLRIDDKGGPPSPRLIT